MGSLAEWVISVLPMSPFAPVIDGLADIPYLAYLNWFLPVGEMITIGGVWLAAISVYYVYSIVVRWVGLTS